MNPDPSIPAAVPSAASATPSASATPAAAVPAAAPAAAPQPVTSVRKVFGGKKRKSGPPAVKS